MYRIIKTVSHQDAKVTKRIRVKIVFIFLKPKKDFLGALGALGVLVACEVRI